MNPLKRAIHHVQEIILNGLSIYKVQFKIFIRSLLWSAFSSMLGVLNAVI